MTIYGSVLPGAISIARGALLTESLSDKAKCRLKILDWHKSHGSNLSLTARHFGIHRRLLREWQKRLAREGPRGLEDKSRRPKRIRRPAVSPDIVAEVVKLRKEEPAWSKHKIKYLLPNHLQTSVSTIGRILKRRGLVDRRISRKRQRAAKSTKPRFPHGMRISSPGDMIQMDTKYIMLPGGKRHYQFTAIDVLTKIRVLDVYRSQSSANGADFLDKCRNEFPFPILAAQSDNGAPFQKNFEKRCKELGLTHFYTYPRSPKQNTYVEISHGADEREFYQQGNVYQDVEVMRTKIKEWQDIWNNRRPHQALHYLTPRQYLEKWQTSRLPTKDIITLQT